MELQISKVNNGYLVQVFGKVTTHESAGLLPGLSNREVKVHHFVFENILDMLVMLHHFFEPPTEAVAIDGAVKDQLMSKMYGDDVLEKYSDMFAAGGAHGSIESQRIGQDGIDSLIYALKKGGKIK